ncbi:hypothetical protein BDY21DRAFT_134152 [Lineolata rhizophorae]|uniref:Uncharacterized protein n=1 Tax=Lineolata rhizophorae TaxID=578093 RepID=A0A6A6PAB4_9PEZI|nr:hypothetical protein BDY21DRAFT_134152 [Lineolata rhizophorae]
MLPMRSSLFSLPLQGHFSHLVHALFPKCIDQTSQQTLNSRYNGIDTSHQEKEAFVTDSAPWSRLSRGEESSVHRPSPSESTKPETGRKKQDAAAKAPSPQPIRRRSTRTAALAARSPMKLDAGNFQQYAKLEKKFRNSAKATTHSRTRGGADDAKLKQASSAPATSRASPALNDGNANSKADKSPLTPFSRRIRDKLDEGRLEVERLQKSKK